MSAPPRLALFRCFRAGRSAIPIGGGSAPGHLFAEASCPYRSVIVSDVLTTEKAQSAMAYVRVDDGGSPFLQGSRCGACGEIFLGLRQDCAKCATRGAMCPMALANH